MPSSVREYAILYVGGKIVQGGFRGGNAIVNPATIIQNITEELNALSRVPGEQGEPGESGMIFLQSTSSGSGSDDQTASEVPITDAGSYFASTDVEAALQEIAAKVVGYQAHGSMGSTETFSAATGWHSATFDANCTFTLSGATSGIAAEMVLELAQNGTGGWLVTLPSSVSNKAALEAAQVTTLSTTSFLVLMTRDGGTTWYGFWAGGSGVTYATPAIVLGTAAAAGAASSVIRSDSTIVAFDATAPTTIAYSDAAATGSAAVAARRDHRHGAPAAGTGIGELLIVDTGASTPLIFADLLQNEAQDDLLYADP